MSGNDSNSDASCGAHPKRRLRLFLIGIITVAIITAMVASLATMIERAREAAARSDCNLGQIVFAIHNYHDEHGMLPPAIVRDANGLPLYSWRVLILPYIEERELYREFRLDEAWDSEQNALLLDRMPTIFAAPWTRYVEVPPGHTVCRVLVGPGTAFERDGLRLPDDFPDGTRKTVLFVEAGEPVPWTRPEEITYDPNRPVELRGLFRDGFRACTASGGYRYITYETSPEQVHAVMTRNGGEKVSLDWRLP